MVYDTLSADIYPHNWRLFHPRYQRTLLAAADNVVPHIYYFYFSNTLQTKLSKAVQFDFQKLFI